MMQVNGIVKFKFEVEVEFAPHSSVDLIQESEKMCSRLESLFKQDGLDRKLVIIGKGVYPTGKTKDVKA